MAELESDINFSVNRTYTVTFRTIAQLGMLEEITGKNKSELVRIAVEDLYNKVAAEFQPAPIEASD